MISLPADENLDANIVRGVLRRLDDIDIVRLQDVDLTGADDPAVLAWAAEHGRVLVTHDVETVTRFAFERVAV
jgi:predicted nuclease of predicted toxin-antitoxin system